MDNVSYIINNGNFQNSIVDDTFDGKTFTPRSKAADPLKTDEDIEKIKRYILYEKPYKNSEMRKRDYLLFILGINIGLRAGDLRALKIGDVLDDSYDVKDMIQLVEEKTEHTRKRKKYRTIYLNDMAKDAIRLFLTGKTIRLNDPLFPSCSNNNSSKYYETLSTKSEKLKEKYTNKTGVQEGIQVRSIERILKGIVKECGINIHASSHMLRKTFAYGIVRNAENFEYGLALAQEALQHSSESMTMRYLGFNEKVMRETYNKLNLGSERKDTSTGNEKKEDVS